MKNLSNRKRDKRKDDTKGDHAFVENFFLNGIPDDIKLLKNVFNSIPDIIGIQDLDHKILYYNQAGYDYFKKRPEDLTDIHCFELIGRTETCDDCAAKIVKETGEPSRITRHSLKHNKWLDIRAYPVFDDNGKIQKIIEHIRDVTEDKKRENDLKNAMERAEESDRLKDSFLENISHEIRTPLNAIIGFSDLIISENPKHTKIAKYIEYIRNSGLGLMQMVNDIIDYSMLESGQLHPDTTSCDVNDLLQELYIIFKDEIERQHKEIELFLTIDKTTEHLVIETDPSRLRQIMWNFLQNAVNFTSRGYIRFGYKRTRSNHILFYVEDTGIGIHSKDLGLIFEKFYTVSSAESNAFKGSGIGLALVKQLAAVLNGKVFVESTPARGSTFYLNIPAIINHPEKSHSDRPVKPMPKYNWENKHILIAEDEELNYLFLQEVLSVTKVKLTWARNGLEAVEFCRDHPGETDLVLMDLKMPQMDGYEATSCIRKIDKEIPVVAQTAYSFSSNKNKSLQSGFSDFLTKPIPARLLLETLNKHLIIK